MNRVLQGRKTNDQKSRKKMFHVLRARAVVILPFADSPFKHCGLASCWLELTFRLSLICCASGGLHRPLVHDTADVLPNTPTAHNTEGVTQERSGQPLLSERFAAAEGTRFPVAAGQDGRGERKEPHGWQHPLRLPSLRDELDHAFSSTLDAAFSIREPK